MEIDCYCICKCRSSRENVFCNSGPLFAVLARLGFVFYLEQMQGPKLTLNKHHIEVKIGFCEYLK